MTPGHLEGTENCEFQETEMVSGLLDTYSSFKKSCQGKEGGAGVEE